MEIIKRKIVLDNYISRSNETWGELIVNSFNINIFFKQEFYDLGINTDVDYIEYDNNLNVDYSPLTDDLINDNYYYDFMLGGIFTPNINNTHNVRNPLLSLEDFYKKGSIVSGLTEDRLDLVKSYDRDSMYKPLFNTNEDVYINYDNVEINGVTRVNSNSDLNPITYSEDVDINDVNIGTNLQTTGIYYETYNNILRNVTTYNEGSTTIPLTNIFYNSEGLNETNSSLSASIKENYLLGITNTPDVESDVFIDRGRTTVLQSHFQLSEIKTLTDLINYGNGYYKIFK